MEKWKNPTIFELMVQFGKFYLNEPIFLADNPTGNLGKLHLIWDEMRTKQNVVSFQTSLKTLIGLSVQKNISREFRT